MRISSIINYPNAAGSRHSARMKSAIAVQVMRNSCGGVSRAPWQRFRAAAWPRAGHAGLLALGCAAGLGCAGTAKHPEADMVGTKRVLAMAETTERPVAHQLQRLHRAFIRDDGTILLQIHGKPVKEAKIQPCTLELPPPKPTSPADTLARRIEVPSSALRLGWDTNAVLGTRLHPLPIGHVLTIKAREAYVWDALELTGGRDEEIRLVQRLGTVSQWEILHLRAHPTAAQARFTIYEVRPTMVPVNHRAALALLPFAVAEDVATNVTVGPATLAAVVAVPVAIAGTVGVPVVGTCKLLWNGTKAVGRAIGLVEKDSPP